MWWSKPKYTVEELERSYVLEERTPPKRIAQMNKPSDRDLKKLKYVQEDYRRTPEQTGPTLKQRIRGT